MEISRRTYHKSDPSQYTHYRMCVKHKLVEGLLVFTIDSHAIYDKQRLLSFLSCLNSWKSNGHITNLMSMAGSLSIKILDATIPLLESYISDIAGEFLNTYKLSMLDQTSQNISNILFFFSSHFKQALSVSFQHCEMKYPDESIDLNTALRTQINAENIVFYYPSLSKRNSYYAKLPVSCFPEMDLERNGIACKMCRRETSEKNSEHCQNMCLICENCWDQYKTETSFHCPVCRTDQTEEKEQLLQQRLCIFINFKKCDLCYEYYERNHLYFCEKGCKICFNCKKVNCSICFREDIPEEKKEGTKNERNKNIYVKEEEKRNKKGNEKQEKKKEETKGLRKKENNRISIDYHCCIHTTRRIICKSKECTKNNLKTGKEGPTHCEICKIIYDIDLLESLSNYQIKLMCNFCRKQRYYRFTYRLGDQEGNLICLDCLRTYEYKGDIQIKYKRNEKNMKQSSFFDCCNEEKLGPVTLCTSRPAHLNHTSHGQCVICNQSLIPNNI